jgi:hypothetical protein
MWLSLSKRLRTKRPGDSSRMNGRVQKGEAYELEGNTNRFGYWNLFPMPHYTNKNYVSCYCCTQLLRICKMYNGSHLGWKWHFGNKLSTTRSDNKIHELATVCLPWQQWTETSVWFNVVGISVFHSCVVVDLWKSLSEWRLSLSECVFVCRRQQLMDLASQQCTYSHDIVREEILASKQITVLERPPYSPDLAPSDFFLFPKILDGFLGFLATQFETLRHI